MGKLEIIIILTFQSALHSKEIGLKFLAIVFAMITIVISSALAEQEDHVVIIINKDNPVSTLTVDEIKDYYFKRKYRWPDGSSVRFIDRSPDVPVRKIFLKDYLDKSNEDVDLYWIGQKLYTGDSAPLRETSDSMTIQFVSSFKGAIGYISQTASKSLTSVKIIKVETGKKD